VGGGRLADGVVAVVVAHDSVFAVNLKIMTGEYRTCHIHGLCSCTVCLRCERGCVSFDHSSWQTAGHNRQTRI